MIRQGAGIELRKQYHSKYGPLVVARPFWPEGYKGYISPPQYVVHVKDHPEKAFRVSRMTLVNQPGYIADINLQPMED